MFSKTTRDISFKLGASSHLTVCTHDRGCIYSHGKLRGVTLSIYFELNRQLVHMHLTLYDANVIICMQCTCLVLKDQLTTEKSLPDNLFPCKSEQKMVPSCIPYAMNCNKK